ncbi:MAG: CtsR family transcriptional regulator [Clostridia bacterium]|nr:CtsR family transcriptional regulator [Clostridia bacterium]
MRMSDIIAQRILQLIEESEENIAEIQRNELAAIVGCAPSQINYVLSSRFTPEQGFIIESRRGGGGYVRVSRIKLNRTSAIMHIINSIGNSLEPMEVRIITENCSQAGLISNETAKLICAAVSTSAMACIPQQLREFLRASIVKQMLLTQI